MKCVCPFTFAARCTQAWAEATGILRVLEERNISNGESLAEQSEVRDSKIWKASKVEMEPVA